MFKKCIDDSGASEEHVSRIRNANRLPLFHSARKPHTRMCFSSRPPMFSPWKSVLSTIAPGGGRLAASVGKELLDKNIKRSPSKILRLPSGAMPLRGSASSVSIGIVGTIPTGTAFSHLSDKLAKV